MVVDGAKHIQQMKYHPSVKCKVSTIHRCIGVLIPKKLLVEK